MKELIKLKRVNCFRRLLVGYYVPVVIFFIAQFVRPSNNQRMITLVVMFIIFSGISFFISKKRKDYIFEINIENNTLVLKYLEWFKNKEFNSSIDQLSLTLLRSETINKDIRAFIIGNGITCLSQYRKNSFDGSEWDEELILRVYNQLTELKENYLKELENTGEHDGSSAS